MIYTHESGNFTVTVADCMTDDFEFLMQGAQSENAKEYSSLDVGTKYEYNVVLSYNGMPYTFFMMSNGGRYPTNSLRYLTKLYTIPPFRQGNGFERFLLPGENAINTAYRSHALVCNFIEDILPSTGIRPYDFYFYSRVPNDFKTVEFINKFARVKWTLVDDRLYLTGRYEHDPLSWKHIIYKGDIDAFDQPSMSIEEYQKRFT